MRDRVGKGPSGPTPEIPAQIPAGADSAETWYEKASQLMERLQGLWVTSGGAVTQPQPAVAASRDENAIDGGEEDMVKILKKAPAMRVIFFYPGEEGTYVDNAHVTLFENGIVHIKSNQEETTTHLQNCEILWNFEVDAEDRSNKVRLLKPKGEGRTSGDEDGVEAAPEAPAKSGKSSSKTTSPELS